MSICALFCMRNIDGMYTSTEEPYIRVLYCRYTTPQLAMPLLDAVLDLSEERMGVVHKL